MRTVYRWRMLAAILPAVLLVVDAPSAAMAKVWSVTYEGTIERWDDQTNLFGLGDNGVGAPFSIEFRFDSDLGSHTIDDQPDRQLYQDNLSGEFGDNPMLSVRMTVDGVSRIATRADIPTHYSVGYHYVSDGPDFEGERRLQTMLYGYSSDADLAGAYTSPIHFTAYLFTAEHPPHGTTLPFDGTPNSVGGYASINWTRSIFPHQQQDRDLEFGGVVSRVTTSQVVPEPATWAMAIFGFGMAGAAIRRRRGMQLVG